MPQSRKIAGLFGPAARGGDLAQSRTIAPRISSREMVAKVLA
jgi:hypothetical protein